jgi:hypothetical protein
MRACLLSIIIISAVAMRISASMAVARCLALGLPVGCRGRMPAVGCWLGGCSRRRRGCRCGCRAGGRGLGSLAQCEARCVGAVTHLPARVGTSPEGAQQGACEQREGRGRTEYRHGGARSDHLAQLSTAHELQATSECRATRQGMRTWHQQAGAGRTRLGSGVGQPGRGRCTAPCTHFADLASRGAASTMMVSSSS